MISTNPASAKAAWDTIETIFQENKRTRTVALKGELCVIQMGDDTPDAYFSKIDSIITLLTDLGSTMDDDDIVTYAINGLSEKYGSLAQIIAHKDPFPDYATIRTWDRLTQIGNMDTGASSHLNYSFINIVLFLILRIFLLFLLVTGILIPAQPQQAP
ncbi:hybrid signal transduction histidine kinase M [Tanacetum coccineum]